MQVLTVGAGQDAAMRRLLVTLVALLAATGCSGDRGGEDGTRPDRQQESSAAGAPAPPVPEARTEVGAGRLGGRIVVLGGLRADGTATERVDVYDLESERWSNGPPLPRALHHPGVTTFGGRLVVAGGYVTDGGAWVEAAEVWSLGEGERAWRAEPSLDTARGALGLAASADHLVAFGGTSSGQVLDTVEVLVRGTDAWRTFPSLRQRREHTAAAAADGRIYAIAGRVGPMETNLTSVESMDPRAFSPEWREEPALQHSRGGTAAAAVGRRLCVAGGEEPAGTVASVECLDDQRWRTVADLAEPRHGLGVVAGHGGRLHVLAGGPRPGLFVSTAHEVVTLEG